RSSARMVQDEELARTEHEEQVFLVNWVATEPRLTYRRRVGLWRPWPLAFQMCLSSRQALSGPAVSGTMSKPNETPRKYQNGPSSRAATASGEDGDSTGVPRLCSSVLDGHTVVLAVPPIPPISLAGWGF